MAVASVVAGVLGLGFIFIPLVGFIPGFAIATPGRIFGMLAHQRSPSRRGTSVVGVVLCTMAVLGAIVNLFSALSLIPWLMA